MIALNEILQKYNLEGYKFMELNKGFVSDKWLIFDDHNILYVLKEITNQTEQRVADILKIQSQLECSAKIIQTYNKKNYTVVDDKIYYMTEYIDNKQGDLKTKIEDLGQFLGEVHNEMKIQKRINTKFLKIENNQDYLIQLLDYYKKNNYQEYFKIIKYKLNILKGINIDDINYLKLSHQIIHGDFYGDNILFDDKNYKLIDFDQTCLFYKEYELMRGMFMMCYDDRKNAADIINAMKLFLKGYFKQNSINSPIDTYNLYLYIQANSLSSLKPNHYLKKEKKEFAKKRYYILKFLYENKKEIINILGG